MRTYSDTMLTKELAYNIQRTGLLLEGVSLRMSFVELTVKNFYLLFATWKLVRSLTKMEKRSCVECDIECNTYINIAGLESIVKDFKAAKEHLRVLGLPSLLLKLESVIIHKIENKVENYWISSDKEIKELALSISNKINAGKNVIQ